MASSIAFDIFARDQASATFDKLGKKVETTESKFGSFAKKAAIAGAVVGAAVVKFASTSVRAYEDAAKSQRVLTDAYARFPKLADVTIDSFRKQADAIQSKTGVDNDAINATQGMLGAYKLTGKQVQDLTPLIVDYAKRTGKSLPDATKVAGKALLGQGRGLKDIGLAFKDTKTPIGNFNELMTGLREKVGGFADKEGKSASGRAEILKAKFQDFQETVGGMLVPALAKLADIGVKVVDWMNKNQGITKVIVIGVVALTGAFIALSIAMAIVELINPFSALALGVAAAVLGVIYLYNHFAIAKRIINDVGDAIKIWALANVAIFKVVGTALGVLVRVFVTIFLNPILAIFGAILHAAVIAFGWIPGLKGPLHKAQSAFSDFRDKVNAIINSILQPKPPKPPRLSTAEFAADVARYKALYNSITGLSGVNYITTVFTNKGTPFPRAAGGPVAPGTTYLVGERGPELFTPNNAGNITPNNRLGSGSGSGGGGGGVTINTVNVYGVQSTSELWQSLQKYAKRNGSLKLSGVTA